MASSPTIATARTHEPMVIAFTDISGYSRAAAGRDDMELAELADELYAATERCAVTSGGRVVKHLGDGSLLVWPVAEADRAAAAVMALRDEVSALLRQRRWHSELQVRVHVGEVVAGPFGAAGAFDVIGHAVMTAARLEARTLSFSQAAFRARPRDAEDAEEAHACDCLRAERRSQALRRDGAGHAAVDSRAQPRSGSSCL